MPRTCSPDAAHMHSLAVSLCVTRRTSCQLRERIGVNLRNLLDAFSVPKDAGEVEPFQLQLAVIVLGDVARVERAIATLRAEVPREVVRAVDVEIEEVALVVVDLGQLEP